MNIYKSSFHLESQCLSCKRLADCGEEKQYRVCNDKINCENFESVGGIIR